MQKFTRFIESIVQYCIKMTHCKFESRKPNCNVTVECSHGIDQQ